MGKTIDVSKKVHKRLKNKKEEYGAKSMNEVINILLERG